MERCGASCTLPSDKALGQYCRPHSRPDFPALGDRPLWVRHAANLWQSKAAIPPRLTPLSGQAAAPSQPLATLPLPGCVSTRSGRGRGVQPDADAGDGAAQALHSEGFKLG
jgi:hypothetical protein